METVKLIVNKAMNILGIYCKEGKCTLCDRFNILTPNGECKHNCPDGFGENLNSTGCLPCEKNCKKKILFLFQ